MNPETNNRDRELEHLLRKNPRGLTVRRLRALIGGSPGYEIQASLLRLQEAGQVRLVDGTRWQWTGRTMHSRAARGEAATSRSPARRMPEWVRPVSVPQNSRWAEFRRLCLYYADCVRLEDRAKVMDYAEHENRRFLTLRTALDWQAVSRGATVAISVPAEWGEFIRHIRNQRRAASRLFLGTPVDVHVGQRRDTGETVRRVSPVFVQQVEFRIQDDMLNLQPVGPVEINHGWLEGRFTRADDRQAFVEVIGLEHPERDTEDDAAEPMAAPTFSDLHVAMAHTCPNDWREPSDLRHLQGAPSLQELSESGLYNRAVLMAQPALKYSGRLYRELLWLAEKADDEDLDGTSLRYLFPHDEPRRELLEPAPAKAEDPKPLGEGVGEYEGMNGEQREACLLGMSKPLSVVTGPPGTGKSRVVAQAMANSALRRCPVLFSSRNHQAIEAVIPRLNALVEPETLAVRLAYPYGHPSAETVTQMIVNMLTTPRQRGVAQTLAGALSELSDILRDRGQAERDRDQVFALYQMLDEAQRKREVAMEGLPARFDAVIDGCSSVPGEGLLVELAQALEGFLAAPAGWLKRLIWRLRRRFRGTRLARQACDADARYAGAFATEPVEFGNIANAPSLERLLKALELWRRTAQAIGAAKEVRRLRGEAEYLPDLEVCHEQFARFQSRVGDATRRALLLLAESYGSGLSGQTKQRFAEIRAELLNYGDNVGRHSRRLRRELEQCFPVLLAEVPLWATSNLTAGKNIPLASGAFDLLIVDEASQCDIASVVPLLFRARRVMVVGDPMQLPHVSTLGRDIDNRLRQRFDLLETRFGRFTYRVNSFFDLVATAATLQEVGGEVQLQDHHRCHGSIADYCNQTFYRKTLRVMTDVQRLNCPQRGGARRGGFCWTPVPADAEPGPGSGTISRGQIKAIVAELRRLVQDGFPGTVGVVTPFRAQANRLRDQAATELGQGIPAHWRFHVDTADGFQGDERDVILLSLPGGADMPRGSHWFLTQGRNRFNVAVSRARALLHVFADEDWCRTCGIPHIQALHRAWAESQRDESPTFRNDLVGPVWEPKLAEALRQAELPFHQQYPACGRYLDFALIREGLMLDVEVDGEAYHRALHGGRKIDDLHRDLALIASGWKVLRFWVYELREDMPGCVERIRNYWEQTEVEKPQEQVGL